LIFFFVLQQNIKTSNKYRKIKKSKNQKTENYFCNHPKLNLFPDLKAKIKSYVDARDVSMR